VRVCGSVGYDHISPGIKGHGYRSRSKVNAVGLTSILDRGSFSSY